MGIGAVLMSVTLVGCAGSAGNSQAGEFDWEKIGASISASPSDASISASPSGVIEVPQAASQAPVPIPAKARRQALKRCDALDEALSPRGSNAEVAAVFAGLDAYAIANMNATCYSKVVLVEAGLLDPVGGPAPDEQDGGPPAAPDEQDIGPGSAVWEENNCEERYAQVSSGMFSPEEVDSMLGAIQQDCPE